MYKIRLKDGTSVYVKAPSYALLMETLMYEGILRSKIKKIWTIRGRTKKEIKVEKGRFDSTRKRKG